MLRTQAAGSSGAQPLKERHERTEELPSLRRSANICRLNRDGAERNHGDLGTAAVMRVCAGAKEFFCCCFFYAYHSSSAIDSFSFFLLMAHYRHPVVTNRL